MRIVEAPAGAEARGMASRWISASVKAIVSLVVGGALTFAIPAGLEAIWPYLRDEHFHLYPGVDALVRLLNLPAVIYCAFFKLPEGLQHGDESLYCWSVGFLFNIPYYSIVIFVSWYLAGKVRRKFAKGAR